MSLYGEKTLSWLQPSSNWFYYLVTSWCQLPEFLFQFLFRSLPSDSASVLWLLNSPLPWNIAQEAHLHLVPLLQIHGPVIDPHYHLFLCLDIHPAPKSTTPGQTQKSIGISFTCEPITQSRGNSIITLLFPATLVSIVCPASSPQAVNQVARNKNHPWPRITYLWILPLVSYSYSFFLQAEWESRGKFGTIQHIESMQ